MPDVAWQINIEISEEEEKTRADALLDVKGERFHGFGQARRAPGDPNVPVVGEELAAARALSDLSHKLLDAAATRIEQF
jgi:hypothetical protein